MGDKYAIFLDVLKEISTKKNDLFLESSNLSNSSKKEVNRMALFSKKLLRKIWLLIKLEGHMMFFMCDLGLVINVFH